MKRGACRSVQLHFEVLDLLRSWSDETWSMYRRGATVDTVVASYGRGLSPPWAAVNAARTRVH